MGSVSESSQSWILLFLIGLLLILQIVLSRRLPIVFRTILYAQVVYSAIGYVLRPIVLLTVLPRPARNDPIADFRLARGGYEQNFPEVLAIVAVGQITVVVLVVLYRIYFANSQRNLQSEGWRSYSTPYEGGIWACYLVGCIARIMWVVGYGGPVINIMMLVGAAAVGMIFVYGLQNSSSGHVATILVFLAGIELLWGVISGSKTPILAVFVTLTVRFALQGWSRRATISTIFIGICATLLFPVLQALKLETTTTSDLTIVDSRYPLFVAQIAPILRRFDLLSAVTDAWSAGSGSWISIGEYLERGFLGLIPDALLSSSKVLAGTRWAAEVRSQSLPTGSNRSVSLAEGSIAEGYVMGGVWGVVVLVTLMFLLTVFTARMFYSRLLIARIFAVALVMQSGLFERGLLGALEDITKAFQAAAIICVAVGFIQILRIHKDQAVEAGKSTNLLPQTVSTMSNRSVELR